MKNKALINIAIADDHPIMRKGISDIISSFEGFNIPIQANDGRELIEQIAKAPILPDICILDISMPNLNGFETIKEIRKRWSSIKVLALSMYNNEFSIIKMLTSGANGYLPKNTNPQHLQRALAAIYYTGYYDSEQAIKNVSGPNQQLKFTEREVEFLGHCCSELSYRQIGELMGISVRTVEGYRDALFEKLDIKSRAGLVMYALRNGIMPIE
jgi:DNA-binding NarL/FixJ family response regulator